jgi:hypothetical protein
MYDHCYERVMLGLRNLRREKIYNSFSPQKMGEGENIHDEINYVSKTTVYPCRFGK